MVISLPQVVEVGDKPRLRFIYRTALGLAYLSAVPDYGSAGFSSMIVILGMETVKTGKY